MELGVCYYPEHWPEDTWAPDAARMKALGLTWVRIGEFAWSALEPSPGELHFDWLDRAVDTLGSAGLKVVLGTPTATPPKWLVDAYPEILPVDAWGRLRGFGSRRHYCFNAESYRRETERIVTLLAERYGHHQAVQAWQTDNEYGHHGTARCYCQNCQRAFRGWLEERYGTIEALNEAWFTVFWSMCYSSFDEVDLPNLTVTEPHPSHSLDFYRFSSDSVVAYNRLQVKILREHSPGRLITHNTAIFFELYDQYKLAEDLDVLAWDNYPLGMLEESPLPDEVKARYLRSGHPDLVGFNHDLYRGVKGKPFWVMEQQPGQVNWAPSNPLPAPGVVRLWSHQAFAHGAEVVSYFRWRAAPGGQELMHAGLNLHDGRPDRASAEVSGVAEEIPNRDGEYRQAGVALLHDYENLWATTLQPHAQGWNYWGLLVGYYAALRSLGLDLDIVSPQRDLSGYKLAFAPALHLVDESLAGHLTRYVERGGHLVLGPRSGAKTLSNRVHAPIPGPLRGLAGVRIDHVDSLRPGVTGAVTIAESSYLYQTWADLLTPEGAEVLGTYQTDAYAGTAAVTQNTYGRGRCTVVGPWGTEAFHLNLFKRLLEQAGLGWLELPEGVRLNRLRRQGILQNFNSEAVATAHLPLELEDGTIAAHDVVFLKL